MVIVIAGAGELGFHIAQSLAQEKHSIKIIDRRSDNLEQIDRVLDVQTLCADAISYETLAQAGVKHCDLFLSVTSQEEVNILATILAKQIGARYTLARVESMEFMQHEGRLNKQGIDSIILPESLAATEIKHLLYQSGSTEIFGFDHSALMLVGLTLESTSKLIGEKVEDFARMPESAPATLVVLTREGKDFLIPKGDTVFEAYDHLYFIVQPDGMEKLLPLSGKKTVKVKNVAIMGGSKIGVYTAEQLMMQKKYAIKLVELDADKSQRIAERFGDIMVINGDVRNMTLLEEEDIFSSSDAFIAATGHSETNIITSLIAKKRGVSRTIAVVENMDYISTAQSIGVDTIINKKLVAADFILRHLRQLGKNNIHDLASLHNIKAEVLAFKVPANARILRSKLKSLDFPSEAVIGGVIRKGVGHPVRGNFSFMPDDKVIVLCVKDQIEEVKKFF